MMKALKRTVSPLVMLGLILMIVIGSAYAYFTVTSKDVDVSGAMGFTSVELVDSYIGDIIPASGSTEFSFEFYNHSALPSQFEIYFVIIWQEETSPGSGQFVDLPLPVDAVKVTALGGLLPGHIYSCNLQPSDNAFTIDGEIDWTAYLSDPAYAGKSPKISFYFNADFVSP